MEELESQIAKITLGNFKQTTSYVYVMAEKASNSEAELYVVAEMPIFNPAAVESCEQICMAISGSLKRAYKKGLNENSFENAISQINEELGKLASLGQTNWFNKLSCIVAAKNQNQFSIATCGKVNAFLLRNNEFTDISCSPAETHPLKTFENYASGKIRLNDLMILSTTELFNHISIDRLKKVLAEKNFLTSTQTLIQLLKDNSGPQVAFGILLNLQVPFGQTQEEEVDLENYLTEQTSVQGWKIHNPFKTAFNVLRHAFDFRNLKRIPKVGLPSVSSVTDNLKSFGKNAKGSGQNLKDAASKGFSAAKNIVNKDKLKSLSPSKKFFLLSAGILLLVFFINVSITAYLKGNRETVEAFNTQVKEVQKLLLDSNSAQLYNDQNSAKDFYKQAQEKFSQIVIPKKQNELYDQTKKQLEELSKKIEKNTDFQITSLGNLSEAEHLIKLPKFFATKTNGQVISFNRETEKFEDGVLKINKEIKSSVQVKESSLVIYTGSSLVIWDSNTNTFGSEFSTSVPTEENTAGIKYYPTNSRVYIIDKANSQIVNFLVTGNNINRPVVSLKTPELLNAQDFAIDGSIYLLNETGIIKFQAGNLAEFNMPVLAKPFAGKGKIYTEVNFKNLYLMDRDNKRILVMDKKGELLNTLQSPQLDKMKDFYVDETNKTFYILNDTALLKLTY